MEEISLSESLYGVISLNSVSHPTRVNFSDVDKVRQ